jgi:uncharacterized OB-fold protein
MSGPALDLPAPIVDDSSRPFWDGARAGKLLIQQCTGCGRLQFYPRAFCAACFEADPAWVEAAGTGRIHTFSVVHRNSDRRFADQLPYVLAIVELDEGVRLTTRILTAGFERLRCELPVRVVFGETQGVCLPLFVPIEGEP